MIQLKDTGPKSEIHQHNPVPEDRKPQLDTNYTRTILGKRSLKRISKVPASDNSPHTLTFYTNHVKLTTPHKHHNIRKDKEKKK